MLLLALEILGYAVMAMSTGAISLYWQRGDLNDSVDGGPIKFLSVLGGLGWPITLVAMVAVGICWTIYKGMMRLAQTVGEVQNRAHIRASKVELMEADLERVGGSLELALRYDYKTCARCWGSGCTECKKAGIQRVKVS